MEQAVPLNSLQDRDGHGAVWHCVMGRSSLLLNLAFTERCLKEHPIQRLIDRDGNTPAHLAAETDCVDIFGRFFKECPWMMTYENKQGVTPLDIVCDRVLSDIGNDTDRAGEWYKSEVFLRYLEEKSGRKLDAVHSASSSEASNVSAPRSDKEVYGGDKYLKGLAELECQPVQREPGISAAAPRFLSYPPLKTQGEKKRGWPPSYLTSVPDDGPPPPVPKHASSTLGASPAPLGRSATGYASSETNNGSAAQLPGLLRHHSHYAGRSNEPEYDRHVPFPLRQWDQIVGINAGLRSDAFLATPVEQPARENLNSSTSSPRPGNLVYGRSKSVFTFSPRLPYPAYQPGPIQTNPGIQPQHPQAAPPTAADDPIAAIRKAMLDDLGMDEAMMEGLNGMEAPSSSHGNHHGGVSSSSARGLVATNAALPSSSSHFASSPFSYPSTSSPSGFFPLLPLPAPAPTPAPVPTPAPKPAVAGDQKADDDSRATLAYLSDTIARLEIREHRDRYPYVPASVRSVPARDLGTLPPMSLETPAAPVALGVSHALTDYDQDFAGVALEGEKAVEGSEGCDVGEVEEDEVEEEEEWDVVDKDDVSDSSAHVAKGDDEGDEADWECI